MSENINQKLNELLRGEKGRVIQEFVSSSEGQKLKNSLSNIDRDMLLKEFMSMNTDELRKKLEKADLKGLSGLSAEEIIRKLR